MRRRPRIGFALPLGKPSSRDAGWTTLASLKRCVPEAVVRVLIERIQVQEGFLDGLDLVLSDGLNVLIGPRGAGKTSIIELLRFALGAETITEAASVRARRHALSVLGSGRVAVTIAHDNFRFEVSRTAEDTSPQSDEALPRVTILAQNEIERVGLQDTGRLRLIDSFISQTGDIKDWTRLLAQIRTLTVEIKNINEELDQLQDQARGLSKVPTELTVARKEEARVLRNTSASETDQKRLKTLQNRAATAALDATLIGRTRERLDEWAQKVSNVLLAVPTVEPWPDGAGPNDLLSSVRAAIPEIVSALDGVESALQELIEELGRTEADARERRSTADKSAREIRVQLEQIQEGAGAITRRVQALQEQASELAALRSLRTARRNRLTQVTESREGVLAELETLQQMRFHQRNQVAQTLSKSLAPRIRVRVQRSEVDRAYQDAIAESLRGSGLHYTTLSPLIAQRMSPRELALAVENGDSSAMATATELSAERASRVLAQMRSSGVEDILTAQIEDRVELSLLDGTEYKKTTELSTGQRCTVVLPIVLSHRGSPVVVDQPEDHLDNAFIAETVITALRNRHVGDQLVVSTHNANIPVLGEADRVVLMGSDGKRGFVRHASSLDDPRTVEAISTLMEGGREAFAVRAAYYRGQPG